MLPLGRFFGPERIRAYSGGVKHALRNARHRGRWAVVLAALFLGSCGSSEVSRSLGAQCNQKSDCDDRCLQGEDYPQGMCTTTCERDRDCPGDSRCVDEEGGVCLYSCTAQVDCEFLGVGWECKEIDSREQDDVEVMVCRG